MARPGPVVAAQKGGTMNVLDENYNWREATPDETRGAAEYMAGVDDNDGCLGRLGALVVGVLLVGLALAVVMPRLIG